MTIYRIPSSLSTIIFDIDSTLYKNEDYAEKQINVQIQRFSDLRSLNYIDGKNMIESYRQEWAKLNGGRQLSLGNVLSDLGISIEESIIWRKELLHPEQYLSYDEKLVLSLRELSQTYKLLCITNNPVSVGRKTLEAIGADSVISEIIGLDTLRLSKPDIKLFELAAQRTGSPIENCLSVGDRYDIDIAMPLEMGMGGIQVDTLSDIYNLKKILDFSYSS